MYVDLAITADSAELYANGLDTIQAEAPGWEPSPVENWLLLAAARMAAEVAVLTGRVPVEIFRYFGTKVLRIPANDPIAATGTVEFTTVDTTGYVISAGTELDVDGVGLATVEDLAILAGQDTGQVAVVALEAGEAGNDLTGDATLIAPTLLFVSAVTVVGETNGGADGETPEEYVDRLAEELPTLSPKVVLVGDAEVRARRHPLVARALAINRYDPGPPDTDAEGHLAIAVHDDTGASIGAPARVEVEADIEANRIRGIDVHVIDPTYTRVDIRFTGRAYPDFDPEAVEAAGEQAIADFIAGAQWGRPRQGPPDEWDDEPVLARNDLFGVLYGVPGMRHVDTLTLARFGDPQDTADIILDGPAALPAADSVVSGDITI